jgi:transposase
MERHGLTDEQFNRLLPLMTRTTARGRPPADHRKMLEGILWILTTGSPWRDLPRSFGSWKTVYDRFRRWTRSGLWSRMLEELRKDLPPCAEDEVLMYCIDGTVIRAHRAAAGASKKHPR